MPSITQWPTSGTAATSRRKKRSPSSAMARNSQFPAHWQQRRTCLSHRFQRKPWKRPLFTINLIMPHTVISRPDPIPESLNACKGWLWRGYRPLLSQTSRIPPSRNSVRYTSLICSPAPWEKLKACAGNLLRIC